MPIFAGAVGSVTVVGPLHMFRPPDGATSFVSPKEHVVPAMRFAPAQPVSSVPAGEADSLTNVTATCCGLTSGTARGSDGFVS